jgi:hypothetical protein
VSEKENDWAQLDDYVLSSADSLSSLYLILATVTNKVVHAILRVFHRLPKLSGAKWAQSSKSVCASEEGRGYTLVEVHLTMILTVGAMLSAPVGYPISILDSDLIFSTGIQGLLEF